MNKQTTDSPDSAALTEAAERRPLQDASDDELLNELHARKSHSGRVSLTVSEQHFSGPVPPPDSLARYKEIDASIPDRIVTMAEVQQKENNAARNKVIDAQSEALAAQIRHDNKRQNRALIVAVLMIACSTLLIAIDKEIYGSVFGGGTLFGLAYLFITGRKRAKQRAADRAQSPDSEFPEARN